MTSSVPYSFIPGAKAKAEEVNANFISVLGKIEETNVKIENTNSQKADRNLSNLDTAGQEILDAKADKIELDGKWVNKVYTIFSSKTFTVNQSITYDLSSYLPNDGNVYEVLFQSYQRTGNVAGNSTSSVLTSDIFTSYGIRLGRCTTRTASSQSSSGSGILPVGAGRTVTYQNIDANGTSGDCGLVAVGYRKVS